MKKQRQYFSWLLLLVCCSLITPLAHADGLTQLMNFYQNTQAMTANFHQVVSDNQGRKLQEVDGTMLLQRPNRFRWDYQKPFEQEIVSDGEKVYLYDVELAQVTVNEVSKTLSASPAALLSGTDQLTQNFDLVALDRPDDLAWVSVAPKQNDTGFNQIELAFNQAGDLSKMHLVDSFGQQTAITFSQQKPNVKISPAQFVFEAPAGVDVLGQ